MAPGYPRRHNRGPPTRFADYKVDQRFDSGRAQRSSQRDEGNRATAPGSADSASSGTGSSSNANAAVADAATQDALLAVEKSRSFYGLLVNDLLDSELSHGFHLPVAELWEEDELPDYSDLVDRPMDLDTVKQNIATGTYEKKGTNGVNVFDDKAVEADLKRVSSNCMKYNVAGSHFYVRAAALLELVESKLRAPRTSPGETAGGAEAVAPHVAAEEGLVCSGRNSRMVDSSKSAKTEKREEGEGISKGEIEEGKVKEKGSRKDGVISATESKDHIVKTDFGTPANRKIVPKAKVGDIKLSPDVHGFTPAALGEKGTGAVQPIAGTSKSRARPRDAESFRQLKSNTTTRFRNTAFAGTKPSGRVEEVEIDGSADYKIAAMGNAHGRHDIKNNGNTKTRAESDIRTKKPTSRVAAGVVVGEEWLKRKEVEDEDAVSSVEIASLFHGDSFAFCSRLLDEIIANPLSRNFYESAEKQPSSIAPSGNVASQRPMDLRTIRQNVTAIKPYSQRCAGGVFFNEEAVLKDLISIFRRYIASALDSSDLLGNAAELLALVNRKATVRRAARAEDAGGATYVMSNGMSPIEAGVGKRAAGNPALAIRGTPADAFPAGSDQMHENRPTRPGANEPETEACDRRTPTAAEQNMADGRGEMVPARMDVDARAIASELPPVRTAERGSGPAVMKAMLPPTKSPTGTTKPSSKRSDHPNSVLPSSKRIKLGRAQLDAQSNTQGKEAALQRAHRRKPMRSGGFSREDAETRQHEIELKRREQEEEEEIALMKLVSVERTEENVKQRQARSKKADTSRSPAIGPTSLRSSRKSRRSPDAARMEGGLSRRVEDTRAQVSDEVVPLRVFRASANHRNTAADQATGGVEDDQAAPVTASGLQIPGNVAFRIASTAGLQRKKGKETKKLRQLKKEHNEKVSEWQAIVDGRNHLESYKSVHLTQTELQKVCDGVETLTFKQMLSVLEILERDMGESEELGTDALVELDIERVSNAALREIQTFLCNPVARLDDDQLGETEKAIEEIEKAIISCMFEVPGGKNGRRKNDCQRE